MKNKKTAIEKEEIEILKIEKIKQEIMEGYEKTGKLPIKRSPRGPLKTQFGWMEKFSDPDNPRFDPEFAMLLQTLGFVSFSRVFTVKTLKFRVYGTVAEERLYFRQMELSQKIYNLLIDERRIAAEKVTALKKKNPNYIPDYKDKDLYPDSISQANWLKKYQDSFPSKLPIFEETSSPVRERICVQVAQAYKAFYENLKSDKKRKNGKPYRSPDKKDGDDYPTLVYNRPNGYNFEWNGEGSHCRIFGFPKIPNGIRINLTGQKQPPKKEAVRGQKLVYDSGSFYLCLTVEEKRVGYPTKAVHAIGIDWGVKRDIQFSTGEFVHFSGKLDILEKKVRKLQRKHRNKKKGIRGKQRQSNNFKKANEKITKIKQKISRTVKYHQMLIATEVCRNSEIVIHENLKIRNMTKSAKGTAAAPGKNVAQKRGLNRSILMRAPAQFFSILKNKANEYGTKLIQVDPSYTSQRCSCCGYTNSENRTSQEEFACLECGFTENADFNASVNIRDRGLGLWDKPRFEKLKSIK